MPQIRAFRALRFNPELVPDLRRVVAPPYDVITPERRSAFAVRDPHNVVAVDLPADPGTGDPDDRYRLAARTYNGWRAEGVLVRDRLPALYVYEQDYAVPGSSARRIQRGFYGRLRLEPFGPNGGVLPHERTMSGPREDRHKLMRATAANLSGIVGLYAHRDGRVAEALGRVAATAPLAEVVDDDGVRHRIWSVPDAGDTAATVATLRDAASAGPITIADGHHRYETALRYRDERRMTQRDDVEAAFDDVLALLIEATEQPITVLATHRVVRELGPSADELVERLGSLFSVRPASREEVLRQFCAGEPGPPDGGRFGCWTRTGGAVLTARREAFEAILPEGGDAVRRLDVSLLAATLEQACGIDATAMTAGRRVGYTKSAEEAVAWVDAAVDGADAAFLLDPTPVAAVMAVAAEGDVMPQKSTYFYPKPLTGLVINPLEG